MCVVVHEDGILFLPAASPSSRPTWINHIAHHPLKHRKPRYHRYVLGILAVQDLGHEIDILNSQLECFNPRQFLLVVKGGNGFTQDVKRFVKIRHPSPLSNIRRFSLLAGYHSLPLWLDLLLGVVAIAVGHKDLILILVMRMMM